MPKPKTSLKITVNKKDEGRKEITIERMDEKTERKEEIENVQIKNTKIITCQKYNRLNQI